MPTTPEIAGLALPWTVHQSMKIIRNVGRRTEAGASLKDMRPEDGLMLYTPL